MAAGGTLIAGILLGTGVAAAGEPSTNGIDFALTMRATPTSASAPSSSHWRWTRGGYEVSNDGAAPVRFARAGKPERAR